MRVEDHRPGSFKLILSRRNLEALLVKLDGHPLGSKCTIERSCEYTIPERISVTLVAEENELHYRSESREGTSAGIMHPDTEEVMSGR